MGVPSEIANLDKAEFIMILIEHILFALFFVSGFCGLVYQVVWLRGAF